MITVASMLDNAAVLMFDREKQTFTNTVLNPYLERAYATLERKLILINSNRLLRTSADIMVDADAIDVTNRADSVVDDLIRPVDVYIYDESVQRYVKIVDFRTVQTDDIIENLSTEVFLWEWQAGIIQFNRTIAGRRVKLRYYAMLDRPPADLKFAAYEDYLIKMTAGYGSEFEMENITRATALYQKAEVAWVEIKGAEVKENQARATRWPSFRRRRSRSAHALRP